MGRRRRAGFAAKRVLLQQPDPICRYCKQTLGKHRYGDDACPNLKWKVGNGEHQWADTEFTEFAPEVA